MHQTTIKFPDIHLKLRDGHKLRGYFANLFEERSDLLHNHVQDGRNIMRYPLVQYKVIDNIPMLIGLEQGARLLIDLFLEIRELYIGDVVYHINSKNLETKEFNVGVINDLRSYKFVSPWLALNPDNFKNFISLPDHDKIAKLKSILTGNILSFFKGLDYFETETILVTTDLKEINVKFKNQTMNGYIGSFTSNVLLPDHIGLGKSPARGFGTIVKSQ